MTLWGNQQLQARLTGDKVREIFRLLAAGQTQVAVAKQFGVSTRLIR
jgi:hypothetical protein